MTAAWVVTGFVAWVLFVIWVVTWAAAAEDDVVPTGVPRQLQERDQVACVLLEARGLTVQEISDRLRIPPATVAGYLERPPARVAT